MLSGKDHGCCQNTDILGDSALPGWYPGGILVVRLAVLGSIRSAQVVPCCFLVLFCVLFYWSCEVEENILNSTLNSKDKISKVQRTLSEFIKCIFRFIQKIWNKNKTNRTFTFLLLFKELPSLNWMFWYWIFVFFFTLYNILLLPVMF